jgi:hypothetical protein
VKTRTCERCDVPFRPGDDIEEIPRESVSGARPAARAHAVCASEGRHGTKRRRGLPHVPGRPAPG